MGLMEKASSFSFVLNVGYGIFTNNRSYKLHLWLERCLYFFGLGLGLETWLLIWNFPEAGHN